MVEVKELTPEEYSEARKEALAENGKEKVPVEKKPKIKEERQKISDEIIQNLLSRGLSPVDIKKVMSNAHGTIDRRYNLKKSRKQQ